MIQELRSVGPQASQVCVKASSPKHVHVCLYVHACLNLLAYVTNKLRHTHADWRAYASAHTQNTACIHKSILMYIHDIRTYIHTHTYETHTYRHTHKCKYTPKHTYTDGCKADALTMHPYRHTHKRMHKHTDKQTNTSTCTRE